MPVHSKNLRLKLLTNVPGHVFWGYRSYMDFIAEHGELEEPVVIADKGFIHRNHTVFSINGHWGGEGLFVVNTQWPLLDVPELIELDDGDVLELGQDSTDYAYQQDQEGYAEWLEQWPERRVREHPKVDGGPRPETLADDLAGARLVVGLNTSALLAAAMAGCPVEAYGAHSMARGLSECREDRLRWLRSIEWNRADLETGNAIAAALADRELARAMPQEAAPTRRAHKASRKKSGSKRARRSKQARRSQSGKSGGTRDGRDGDANTRDGA